MPAYAYRVKSYEGDVFEATLQASSRQEALSLIHQRAPGVVVDFRELGVANSSIVSSAVLAGRKEPKLRGGWIRPRDLTIFFRQMSVSVNAGVPLRESLESIIEDLDHAGLRRVLQRVSALINDGAPFSLALAAEKNTFPTLCVALIRTAEEAGTMAKTLDQLATNLEKADALSRKIKSILAYPAFVAGFFVIVMLIMTFFILPQFQAIFEGWNAELPFLTRAVFATNKFILNNVVIELVLLVLLIGSFLLWRRSEIGRWQLDTFKLKIPGVGEVVRKIAFARFCTNFAMMVRGGVPIAQGLEIAAGVTVNRIIEKALMSARQRIMMGSDIGSSLGREEIFPRLLVRMVGIGESSGRLPEVLDKVAETYEGDVEAAVSAATSILEPLIIVVFGAIVLVLVLAIYLPVFTTASNVQ